jgi:PTS system nitrogen regulatory IIA component
MRVSVREAAGLLNVSEKTIYRWIALGKLPAYRVNEQYRLNRAELLEWATSQRVNVSATIMEEPDEGGAMPSLEDALRCGGVFYRVEGADKQAVLKSVVEVMSLPDEVDRPFLLQVLLARESVGSTGVGEGIAIPHVRNPIVLHIARPMVALCFLEHPVDFGALDGKPVHTLFAIVSPTIRGHLGLLSRLAYSLRDPDFAAMIARQGSREEILQQVRRIDSLVAQTTPQAGAK